jgi:hypothetical protein
MEDFSKQISNKNKIDSLILTQFPQKTMNQIVLKNPQFINFLTRNFDPLIHVLLHAKIQQHKIISNTHIDRINQS